MIQINKINKTNIEHFDEVLVLCDEAKSYLESFDWCEKITNGWLIKDWGYILCIFYFEIKATKGSGADKNVWIIVGDVPPAYIDIESAKTAKEALNCYVLLMEDWIEHINNKESVEDCFPINVSPTKKNAKMLSTRMAIINEDYIPQLT